jgi:hypothetical protein
MGKAKLGSLTQKEEDRFRLFENRVPRRILGQKKNG